MKTTGETSKLIYNRVFTARYFGVEHQSDNCSDFNFLVTKDTFVKFCCIKADTMFKLHLVTPRLIFLGILQETGDSFREK